MQPPAPPHDDARLAEVATYGLLDRDDDIGLTGVAEVARAVFNAPISLVGFVDRDRQWFTAHVGLDVSETPRDNSFCNHAIAGDDDLFIVRDAKNDAWFHDHPFVTGPPHIGFYCAAVLRSKQGHRLGTLCVIDYEAREPTADQLRALSALRDQVVARLEARRGIIALRKEEEEARQLLARLANDTMEPVQALALRLAALAVNGDIEAFHAKANAELERIRRFVSGLQQVAGGNPAVQVRTSRNDVADVVRTVIDNHVAAAEQARVALEVHSQGAVPIECDAQHIGHAIDHLIQNAIRHATSRVVVEVRPRGTDATVEVMDDGHGFAPEAAHRLFEPGFQGVNPGRDGMGLFVAKQLLEKHGCQLTATSAGFGKGARFGIHIPAKIILRAPEAN